MKILFSTLFLFSFFACSSPEVNSTDLGKFQLTIPAGFEQMKTDASADEILKLNYKNELYIIVQDNLGDLIEENKTLGSIALETVQKIKFIKLKSAYQGFDEGEIEKGEINGNNYLSQTFSSKESFGNVYYDYRVFKIGDDYFEFIITGKESMKEKHQKLLDGFYNSIQTK